MLLLKRHLFNVLAGVSLLLCLSTALIWAARIRFQTWHVHLLPGRWGWNASLRPADALGPNARIYLNLFHWLPSAEKDFTSGEWSSFVSANTIAFIRWGYGFGATEYYRVVQMPDGRTAHLAAAANGHWVCFPDYAPVIAFSLLPTVALVRRQNRLKRAAHGLCVACGYDLRATPNRCPECGVVPVKLG